MMWGLFLIGIVAAAISGQVIDLTFVNWRIVEVATIMTGATALVSAIGDVRRAIAGSELASRRPRVWSQVLVLQSIAPRYLDIIDLRIRSGASNLHQYEAVRHWFQHVRDSALRQADEPKLLIPAQPPFPADIDDLEIVALHREVQDALDGHDKAVAEFVEKKKRTEKGGLEEALMWVSPLLLTVAISLSLFKALYQ